jgi:glycosyltransferase involved in cell wall biosynthesis
MNEEILLREYQNLCPDVQKVYVVPLINYSFKKTNYLYLLYKNFIVPKDPIGEGEKYKIDIESLSVFAHPKIVLSKLKGEKTVVHYHWLEINDIQSLIGMKWKLVWISLYRLFNGKIIWTIHNEFPHSGKYIFLNKVIRKYVAHIANKLQVHCQTAIKIMSPILNVKESKFFIVNHPEFPAELIEKNKAVHLLNQKYFSGKIKSGNILFLMFGEIAEYKGIKEIVKIFNTLSNEKKLIIVGTVKKGNKNYFKNCVSSIENKDQILTYTERIPDEEVPIFINSCDYVLFNYRNVLTSGSVFLALNYKKNIIIPLKGCLKELSGQNVISFNEESDLKNILLTI